MTFEVNLDNQVPYYGKETENWGGARTSVKLHLIEVEFTEYRVEVLFRSRVRDTINYRDIRDIPYQEHPPTDFVEEIN